MSSTCFLVRLSQTPFSTPVTALTGMETFFLHQVDGAADRGGLGRAKSA